MIISLIWAMADNRVIGNRNHLPWKLPADMRWFRRHTLGKPVVMGRRTFESFGGRPLPDRLNIVVSRDPAYQAEGAMVAGSIDAALAAAKNAPEVMVIGGQSFYEQTLPLAKRLYMTLVHGRFEGDAWFPPFDLTRWKEVVREEHPADERNPWPCTFVILERLS